MRKIFGSCPFSEVLMGCFEGSTKIIGKEDEERGSVGANFFAIIFFYHWLLENVTEFSQSGGEMF